MDYSDMIKIISSSNIGVIERGEQLLHDYCNVISSILDYKYTLDHYHGENDDVYTNRINSISKALSILLGDVDVYMDILNITEKTHTAKKERIKKIATKIQR